MNVQVNKDWRITSDSYNFVTESYHASEPTKANPEDHKWVQEGFYPSLESACDGLLRKTLCKSDVDTLEGLKQLIRDTVACTREVKEVVKHDTLSR